MSLLDHPEDYDFDEDGNPEYIGPPKEEPDCPPCGDSGVVVSSWRRNGRPCPSCRPGWLWRHAWGPLAELRWRVRDRLAGPARYDDEAPF